MLITGMVATRTPSGEQERAFAPWRHIPARIAAVSAARCNRCMQFVWSDACDNSRGQQKCQCSACTGERRRAAATLRCAISSVAASRCSHRAAAVAVPAFSFSRPVERASRENVQLAFAWWRGHWMLTACAGGRSAGHSQPRFARHGAAIAHAARGDERCGSLSCSRS
jgi:hypothetical protein